MVDHLSSGLSYQRILPIIFVFAANAFSLQQTNAQWTQSPGSGWIDVGAFLHETTDRYDEDGSVVPLFGTSGKSVTRSVVVSSSIGIFPGIDANLSVPFHFLTFDDLAGDRSSNGIGDVRFGARISTGIKWIPDIPVAAAIRLGMKFPVQEFDVDSEIIPLTEGQTDYEIALEVGRSLWPSPVYIQSWFGYRWRTLNNGIARKPGDEWFGFVAIGGSLKRLEWKIAADGFSGRTPILLGLPIPSAKKQLVRIEPKLGIKIGPGAANIGSTIPMAGKNYLAGISFFAGYFVRI